MALRGLVLLLVAGCSFRHGAAASRGDAAAPDAPADAADGGPSCLARWHSGDLHFGAATLMTDVSSGSYDRDPFLFANETQIVVSSTRTGSQGADLWTATRASRDVAFPALTPLADLNSSGGEGKMSVTTDGEDAVFATDRDGTVYVFEATRGSATARWSAPDATNELMLDIPATNAFDPFIDGSGLRVYGAPGPPGSPQYLAVATRALRGDAFSAYSPISELYSGFGEADPTLSPDETVIVYSSQQPGAAGGGDLWYAVRDTATAAFGTAQPVPDVDTADGEADAYLSDDGCRLYFARRVANTTTDWDIYVAALQ